jgi:transposase
VSLWEISHGHGDSLDHPGAYHVPGRGAAEVVEQLVGAPVSVAGRSPGLSSGCGKAWLVPFLRALTRHLRGSFVLVWDRLPGHRAQVVTEYLHHRRRAVALLPPYAPELNPVEILWAYLKRNPLANFAAADAPHLARVATRHVQDVRRRPQLLRSFFDATPLSFSH